MPKKQEPIPTLKAATRLLTRIFSAAIDTPEFQRQVASPNVPKFALALIAVAEDHPSRELKVSHSRVPFPVPAHSTFSYSPLTRCTCWYHSILPFSRLFTDGSLRSVFANSMARWDGRRMVRSLKPLRDCTQSFLLLGGRLVQPPCGGNPWMRSCLWAGHRFTLSGLRSLVTV